MGITTQVRGNIVRNSHSEGQSLRVRLYAHQVGYLVHVFAQIEDSHLEHDFPRFDLGQVQDVVDQGQQVSSPALGDGGVSALLRVQVCFLKQADHAKHSVHRRADFVAHFGQKAALGQIRFLGRLPGLKHAALGQFTLGDVDVLDQNPYTAIDQKSELLFR